VIEVGGEKVVISGNAGGFNADQSIKNEFHIEANGVDNHVADAFSYGPITSGPLSDPVLFPNSRIVTGTAKNGVEVELRVWDGGEPGKDTDLVYVKLNGSELLGPGGQFCRHRQHAVSQQLSRSGLSDDALREARPRSSDRGRVCFMPAVTAVGACPFDHLCGRAIVKRCITRVWHRRHRRPEP
jgi:hypothetical protein